MATPPAVLAVSTPVAAALARGASTLLLPVVGELVQGPSVEPLVAAGRSAWRGPEADAPWITTRGAPPTALRPTPRVTARAVVLEPWRVRHADGPHVLVEYEADGAQSWRTSHFRESRALSLAFQPAASMPAELARRGLVIVAQRAARAGDVPASLVETLGLPEAEPGAAGLVRPVAGVAPWLASWWAACWPEQDPLAAQSWLWVVHVEAYEVGTHAR